MSHFTVLVIGDDVDEQLAPFHEFECTGIDDEYVQNIDKTTEIKDEYTGADHERYPNFREYVKDYYGHEELASGETPSGKHMYGYTEIDNDGDVVKVIERTNPNAKWDWYQIGGRWAGAFRLKPILVIPGDVEGFAPTEIYRLAKMKDVSPDKYMKVTNKYEGETSVIRKIVDDFLSSPGGSYPRASPLNFSGGISAEERKELEASPVADSALMKDIDWDYMVKEKEEAFAKEYDRIAEAVGVDSNGSILQPDLSWEETSKIPDLDIAERRALYNTQPEVKAIRELEFGYDIEGFNMSKEDYIASARGQALSFYAVIKDGEWYDSGQMGWFGVSAASNEDRAQWAESFYSNFIEGLDDDTLLTCVDCHI